MISIFIPTLVERGKERWEERENQKNKGREERKSVRREKIMNSY